MTFEEFEKAEKESRLAYIYIEHLNSMIVNDASNDYSNILIDAKDKVIKKLESILKEI